MSTARLLVAQMPAPQAQAVTDVAGILVIVVGVAAVAGAFVLDQRRRRRKQEGLARLLARDPALRLTDAPCGYEPDALAGSPATPRGDRRYGARYGVTGPIAVTLADQPTSLECATFQWWYEDRRTSTGKHGRSTHYVQLTRVVAAVSLPTFVADRIVIAPESVLGRAGLTRGGHQFESSEFNRRFRVTSHDRTLSVHLLGPQLQQRLVEEFPGRTIYLSGDLLLLGGDPTHRDGSLPGVIGALPAVRQDIIRLLDAFPPQFWRAVAASHQEG